MLDRLFAPAPAVVEEEEGTGDGDARDDIRRRPAAVELVPTRDDDTLAPHLC